MSYFVSGTKQCDFIEVGSVSVLQGDFFTGTPPKSTEKLPQARLGVPRMIYVNVDSPNLGFPYFNFLGGSSEKNHPVYWEEAMYASAILW